MQNTLAQRKVKGKIENGFHGIFSKALRKQRETISFKASTRLQDRVKRFRKGGWFWREFPEKGFVRKTCYSLGNDWCYTPADGWFNQHRERIPSSYERTGGYLATGSRLISRKTHPAEVAQVLKNSKVEEDTRERPINFEDEGVDVYQMSAISLMFDTLSTERLNGCQISRYRPFRGYQSVRGSCSQPNNFYFWWRSKSKEVWHSPTLAEVCCQYQRS